LQLKLALNQAAHGDCQLLHLLRELPMSPPGASQGSVAAQAAALAPAQAQAPREQQRACQDASR
jgi:hypothetical protein